jgi:hypothetical protein
VLHETKGGKGLEEDHHQGRHRTDHQFGFSFTLLSHHLLIVEAKGKGRKQVVLVGLGFGIFWEFVVF